MSVFDLFRDFVCRWQCILQAYQDILWCQGPAIWCWQALQLGEDCWCDHKPKQWWFSLTSVPPLLSTFMLTPSPSQLLPPSLVLQWQVTSSGTPISLAPAPRPGSNWGFCNIFSTWLTLSSCPISTSSLSLVPSLHLPSLLFYPPWITAVQSGTLLQCPLLVSSSLFRELIHSLSSSTLQARRKKKQMVMAVGASSRATLSYHPDPPLTPHPHPNPCKAPSLLPSHYFVCQNINHLFFFISVLSCGIVYLTVLFVVLQPFHLSGSLNQPLF